MPVGVQDRAPVPSHNVKHAEPAPIAGAGSVSVSLSPDVVETLGEDACQGRSMVEISDSDISTSTWS